MCRFASIALKLIAICLYLGANYCLELKDFTKPTSKCCHSTQLLSGNLSCTKNTVRYLNYYYVGRNPEKDEEEEKYDAVNATREATFFDDCNSNEWCSDYVTWSTNTNATRGPMMVSCERDDTYDLPLSHVFHKCCPANYSYDTSTKSCTPTDANDNRTLTMPGWKEPILVKIGLSTCRTPIVDYDGDTLDALRVDHELDRLHSDDYCLDRDGSDGYVLRVCHKSLDVCRTNERQPDRPRCFKKCCADGYHYDKRNKCAATINKGIHLDDARIGNFSDGNIGLIAGVGCLKYMPNAELRFHVDEYGSLHIYERGVLRTHSVAEDTYCIEYFDGYDEQFVLLCADTTTDIKFQLSRVVLTISCVLLLCTVVVYLTLPKLLNLFGKTLVCYCCCLACAFSLTAFTQFEGHKTTKLCTILSFLIIYTFLMAFSWLNIMSIDIWLTFRSLRAQSVNQQKSERKKFIVYSLYAWSVSTIWMLVTLMIYLFASDLPDHFRLKVESTKCFFKTPREDNYAHLIFFVAPVAVLTVCNIYLFVSTICYYVKVKSAISNMSDTGRSKFMADKERLSVMLKLFVIMGVLWIFEVLTSFYSLQSFETWRHVETTFDILNAAHGIFIFCIFVLKKKVFEAFKTKFGRKSTEEPSSNNTETYTIKSVSVKND